MSAKGVVPVAVKRLSYDGPLMEAPNEAVYSEYLEVFVDGELVDREGTGRRFVWVDGKVVEYDGSIG